MLTYAPVQSPHDLRLHPRTPAAYPRMGAAGLTFSPADDPNQLLRDVGRKPARVLHRRRRARRPPHCGFHRDPPFGWLHW